MRQGQTEQGLCLEKYTTENDAELIIQDEMMSYFLKGLNEIGVSDKNFVEERLKLDVKINTQGLIYWQQKISSN